jgi:hypothetical protein
MITLNCISSHASSAMPPTKLSLLRAAAGAGEWPRALSIAAKFPQLGAHKEAITRAHNAIQSPSFYQQLGQDPAALVAAGIAALQARYRLP